MKTLVFTGMLILMGFVHSMAEVPSIVVQPVGGIVSVGQTTSLSATAQGDHLSYQWMKDGVRLAGRTNSVLTFAAYQFTDGGSYQMVVTNASGMAISRPALLSTPAAPLWASGLNDYGQVCGSITDDEVYAFVHVTNGVAKSASGADHSLFLLNDGSLWAAGNNDYGQLGTNSLPLRRSPPLRVANGVIALAAGCYYSLFITTDGRLWGMGYNESGNLGVGTDTNVWGCVPVASNVVAAAGGDDHSLFLKNDGTLWSMGWNGYGQLGTGGSDDFYYSPIRVASNVVSIAAGGCHSLFVKADGTLWAMGGNWRGQLGLGTVTDVYQPVKVASNVIAAAAGALSSFFITADGALWAVGANEMGQLGSGYPSDLDVPVCVATGVTSVSSGYYQTLFTKSDGTLWGMGLNNMGMLGFPRDPMADRFYLPLKLPGFVVASIATMSSAYHSLVVGSFQQAPNLTNRTVLFGSPFSLDGTVWGDSGPFTYQWQLNGTNMVGATNACYSVEASSGANMGTYTVITSGNNGSRRHTATVAGVTVMITAQPSGSVVPVGHSACLSVAAQGGNLAYQWYKDGVKLTGRTNSVLAFSSFKFTDGGSYRVVVTNATGKALSLPALVSVPNAPLKAWGGNGSGQLGDGSTVNATRPFQVANNVVAAAAGRFHSLFVTSDGTLWGVGSNNYGQLGDEGWSEFFGIASNVVAVAAGYTHSLYVTSKGSLWAIGDNRDGALGNGFTNGTCRPLLVANDVVAAAAGQYHSLFLKNDGTLWAMGRNASGQLGNGTTTGASLPILITNGVVSIASGWNHSLFVRSDDTLWTIGENGYGQLGIGNKNDSLVPVRVTNAVAAVAGGYRHTFFVQTNGTLWAFGSNGNGQLGTGGYSTTSVPKQVTTGVVAAAAGYQHSLFVKADGTLWGMGANNYGQLGNGTTTGTNLPCEVVGQTVASLGTLCEHSLAVGASLVRLTVRSAHDVSDPATGVWSYVEGSVLTNVVTSPVVEATTQYVCKGWSMSGGTSTSGSGLCNVCVISNDVVLTWLWQTNYWLATAAGPHGAVNVGSGWLALGVTTQITATAEQYYHFANWTGGADGSANPLNLLMDRPKNVTANFAADMTVNNPTPHWWLAQYGLTVNFEQAVLADIDGDSHAAWQEYVAGTVPTNRASVFRSFISVSNYLPRLTWTPDLGTARVYSVRGKINLTEAVWGPTNAASRFFRVKVQMP